MAVIKNKPKSRWKHQEENQREVNGTPSKRTDRRPAPKISIGRVQNKLAVDSPRDETKGPFCPGGDRAPGRGICIRSLGMADSARASPHPCRGPPQSRSAGSVVRHHPPGWLATCGGTPERKCILDMPRGTRSHFFNTAGNFPKSHQLHFRRAPVTGLRGLPPCSDGCEVAPDLGVSRVSFVAGVCLRCTSTA